MFVFTILYLQTKPNETVCPVIFDSVLCWPQTSAGTLAILPCFNEFKGMKYDSSRKSQIILYYYRKLFFFSFWATGNNNNNNNCTWKYIWFSVFCFFFASSIENATRYCYPNGTWENANFDQCQYLGESTMVHEFMPSVDLPFYIYCIGNILSLISLSLGLVVFIRFKQVFLL